MLLALLIVLNLLISWWNAYVTGKTWDETKREGGWRHFTNWCGWLQSAFGFSWCILIVLVFGGIKSGAVEWLTPATGLVAIKMGYLVLAPGIILSGIALVVDSWVQAVRTKRIGDIAVATYNTAAMASNVYDFAKHSGGFWDDIGKWWKDGDKDSDSAKLYLVVLVGLCIVGGFVLAALISNRARLGERRRHALELSGAERASRAA